MGGGGEVEGRKGREIGDEVKGLKASERVKSEQKG